MRRPNLRIIGIEEEEDLQLKGPVNIFNKIIEENFHTERDIQEAYRILNRCDQKRNSSCHIVIKAPNSQHKERILKEVRENGQDTTRRPNLRKISVEESEDSQLKGPVNIFNKIIQNSHNIRDTHTHTRSL